MNVRRIGILLALFPLAALGFYLGGWQNVALLVAGFIVGMHLD